MSRKFFSGGTLEQAVLAAARHYGIEPERVAYTQRDKRSGFLNLRRKVVIEVDPAAPERPPGEEVPWQPKLAGRPERKAPPAPSAPPPPRDQGAEKRAASPSPASRAKETGERRPSPAGGGGRPPRGRDRGRREDRQAAAPPPPAAAERPAPPPSTTAPPPAAAAGRVKGEPVTDDPLEAADMALGDLAELMLFDLQWEIRLDENNALEVELGGEDAERLVAEDGKLLRSMEHLLPRLLRAKLGHSLPCSLDCNGFRELHESSLEAFAKRVAEEVRKTQRSRLLDPMTPADRRTVHVTLANDPTVETRSEGSGFTKRVRVSPA